VALRRRFIRCARNGERRCRTPRSADSDLAFDRIEYIEKTAGAALKSYLGYLNA
jgi:hypothetical protein